MTLSIVPTRASDAHPTAPPTRGCEASHTRRTLLAAAAAAPALALPALTRVEAAPEHDPHPAWFAEWRELLRWCNTADVGGRELREFPQWDRLEELEELISTTSAVTLAGVRVQLAQLHHVITEVGVPNEDDVTGLANALATLDRLTGEGRA